MIELNLFIILNILGAITTLLILAFKQLPADEENDEAGGWRGMAFLCAIISTIIWLVLAVSSISIGYTQPYALIDTNTSTVITGTYTVTFPDTWPFSLVYALISVLPFVLILYLWPETWRKNKNE